MGLGLIEVTEPFVKAVFVRDARGAFVAQAPLAEGCRVVTGRLEDFCHGEVGGIQRHARVAANPRVSGMLTGHQTTTRRRADRAASVALSEMHPFLRKPVNVRRLDSFLPVTTEVAVTEVVGENENDVRSAVAFRAQAFELRQRRTAIQRTHEERQAERAAGPEFHAGHVIKTTRETANKINGWTSQALATPE